MGNAGGVTVVFDKTKDVEKAVTEAAMGVALKEAALSVVAAAKPRAPVDTGLLRGSVSFSADGGAVEKIESPATAKDGVHVSNKNEAVVGTNVEYAPYQEYGTSKMSAKEFLRPALDENVNEISNRMKETYRAAIKAVTG